LQRHLSTLAKYLPLHYNIAIMHLSLIVSLLASVVIAGAQNIIIEVGGNASTPGGPAQFLPASVTASKGSVVTFRFSGAPDNHTVTQSSFSNPCELLQGGFDSGWIAVPQGLSLSEAPEWNLTITDDSTPIWYYCKQVSPVPHCNVGMVGAINAPTSGSDTFEAFQNAARSFSGTPDQSDGALVGPGASASAPPGPFASGVTGYSIPTGTAPPSSASKTSTASSASTATGAATHLTANNFIMLSATVLGVSLVNVGGYAILGALGFVLTYMSAISIY